MGTRLLGYDNAHPVPARGGFSRRSTVADHWHRTVGDKGVPYKFTTAPQLLQDFFESVRRTLTERGIELRTSDSPQERTP